ncbi:hypothetical protein BDA99DRAFT_278736 [Phascolomyces articulosus]|uniref:PEP5/VPS11 N-terminal domain-containing protein n=1 Tax=Phascolomyces articulosus TaxID=60185 RepID=A0AAD5PI35_9FUNG|nr:hypothetical protein BDA99DRAFT_278736 [Phascolomyces articulosus]
MSIAQWRQFNFFDKQQAVDPNDKSRAPAVFQKSDISVITSGRGQIALADIPKVRFILVIVTSKLILLSRMMEAVLLT